eukprot:2938089-Rhodomonas_salina.1
MRLRLQRHKASTVQTLYCAVQSRVGFVPAGRCSRKTPRVLHRFIAASGTAVASSISSTACATTRSLSTA